MLMDRRKLPVTIIGVGASLHSRVKRKPHVPGGIFASRKLIRIKTKTKNETAGLVIMKVTMN